MEPLPDQCSEAFHLHSVLDKDVERVIKGFSSNKAPGYDRVSARVLKDSLPVILPSITSIMNYSFHTGTFARAWKIAEVTPILKFYPILGPKRRLEFLQNRTVSC